MVVRAERATLTTPVYHDATCNILDAATPPTPRLSFSYGRTSYRDDVRAGAVSGRVAPCPMSPENPPEETALRGPVNSRNLSMEICVSVAASAAAFDPLLILL